MNNFLTACLILTLIGTQAMAQDYEMGKKEARDKDYKKSKDQENRKEKDREYKKDKDQEYKEDKDREYKKDKDQEYKEDKDKEYKKNKDQEYKEDSDKEYKKDKDREYKEGDNNSNGRYEDTRNGGGILGKVIFPQDRGNSPRELTGIPKGHYPPPGSCRVWYPNRPAGQQPPPTSCDNLRGKRLEPGAFILHGDRAYDAEYDWREEERRRPGTVGRDILDVLFPNRQRN